MNSSARNHLLSVFSWVSRQAGETTEVASNQLNFWLHQGLRAFPRACDECGELLGTSKELPDVLLLEQGNQEWKPETGDYSSVG